MALPAKKLPPIPKIQPTELKIQSVTNLTTKTRIEQGKWIFGDGRTDPSKKDLHLSVQAIRNDGVICELPKNFCAGGHKIRLVFQFTSPNKNFEFSVDGKITVVDHHRELPDRAEFQFDVFDASAWSLVLNAANENQARVLDLFKRIKGDE
jgi:hypothetical protein